MLKLKKSDNSNMLVIDGNCPNCDTPYAMIIVGYTSNVKNQSKSKIHIECFKCRHTLTSTVQELSNKEYIRKDDDN